MSAHHRKSKSTDKEHLCKGPVPSPTSAIRACLYTNTAQIFPAPIVCTHSYDGNLMVHAARGELSGDRISAPETKEARTMELIDIAAKCRTLLFSRMELQSKSVGTVAAS